MVGNAGMGELYCESVAPKTPCFLWDPEPFARGLLKQPKSRRKCLCANNLRRGLKPLGRLWHSMAAGIFWALKLAKKLACGKRVACRGRRIAHVFIRGGLVSLGEWWCPVRFSRRDHI